MNVEKKKRNFYFPPSQDCTPPDRSFSGALSAFVGLESSFVLLLLSGPALPQPRLCPLLARKETSQVV